MQEKTNQQAATNQNASSRNILELANKKLIFKSDLNPNSNHEYIKTLNKSFLNADLKKLEKFKKQIDKCAQNDLDSMIQKICDLEQEEAKKKFGIYLDDKSKNKMSSLMREHCTLIDYKNILWEILNTNKNCEGGLADNFKETSDSRVDNLIKLDFRDNSRSDNDILSDVDENYFAYAKDEKNLDRYFMYFSMLKYLSGFYSQEAIDEFNKYNVEKINQIKKQIEWEQQSISNCKNKIANLKNEIDRIKNSIDKSKQESSSKTSHVEKLEDIEKAQGYIKDTAKKSNLVLEYEKKILELEQKNQELKQIINHPLAKFYTENHEQIITVKKEIDSIKQEWKRQYYRFILAFMLENPDQIYKLEKIFDKNFPTVDFIEFLIKNNGHNKFFYACLEFDNLAKKLKLGFSEKELKLKTELQKKYQSTINGLDENKSNLINLSLSKNREITLERQYMRTANWILFWCGLSVLIVVSAPILALIIANIPFILFDIGIAIFLIIPTIFVAALDSFCSPDSVSEAGTGIVRVMWGSAPWIAPRSFSIISTCYPSVFFITALGISVAVFVVTGIFWVYKKIRYNNFVKSLKYQSKTYSYQKLIDNNIEQKLNTLDQQDKNNADHVPATITETENNLQK